MSTQDQTATSHLALGWMHVIVRVTLTALHACDNLRVLEMAKARTIPVVKRIIQCPPGNSPYNLASLHSEPSWSLESLSISLLVFAPLRLKRLSAAENFVLSRIFDVSSYFGGSIHIMRTITEGIKNKICLWHSKHKPFWDGRAGFSLLACSFDFEN